MHVLQSPIPYKCLVLSQTGVSTHLNLVNINLPILLLNLLVCLLHRVERRHCVSQVIGGHGRALHVERLLRELRNLFFVHLLLLECAQSALLDGVLHSSSCRSKDRGV